MSETIDNERLVEFDGPRRARFVRFYPVEAAKVWHAVTDSEALNVWLYPVSRVEPRLGGACTFTWGSPEAPVMQGRVSRFEPITCVRYEFSSERYIQFSLMPETGGTRLTFTQHFGQDYRHPDDGEISERHGAQPAGPGSPWRAGFLAGFHLNFWFLSTFLVEDWPAERIARESRRCVEGTNSGKYTAAWEEPEGEWERLVEIYYGHIDACCPPS